MTTYNSVCRFCGRWFRNQQCTRAHLQWCRAYQQRAPQAPRAPDPFPPDALSPLTGPWVPETAAETARLNAVRAADLRHHRLLAAALNYTRSKLKRAVAQWDITAAAARRLEPTYMDTVEQALKADPDLNQADVKDLIDQLLTEKMDA